jgi:cystathionine beta-synthase
VVILNSVADAIGNTPVIKLSRFAGQMNHNLLAKCEFLNPGGSIKDRIARQMVQKAEQDGRLKPGGTMVEATAGNTGLGLAMMAALGGYKLICVVSAKVSQDKVRLLQRLGAEIVVAPSGRSSSDPDHFLNQARQIAKNCGGWLVDQFNNEDNVHAHYEMTGPEIWEQTGGAVDVLVAGVGTGGTLSGVGKFLKEKKPSIKVVLADPIGSILAGHVSGKVTISASYLVEGIGQDFIPGNLNVNLIDDVLSVSDSESVEAAYNLMRLEGIFVGSSSGCIAAAAAKYSKKLLGTQQNIVAILPDGGRGYMTTLYDDDWLRMKLAAV